MGQHLVEMLSKDDNSEVYVTTRKRRDDVPRVHYLQGNAHDDTFLKDILPKNQWDAIVDFMVYNTEEFAKRVN